MRRHKSYLDEIPFSALRFDAHVQRATILARVKKLIREWVLDDVGIITVSKRRDGYYVIDGQHRVRAAMELGLGTTKVKCLVYTDLTLQEEARKFLTLNDSRLVSAFDKFNVGLVAGDELCVGIEATLKRHGLRVGRAKADGVAVCIDKIMAIGGRSLDLLDAVCRVIVETWGTRPVALEGLIFTALHQVLARYDGELDRAVLVQKLAKYRGGPSALIGNAKGLSDYRPITVASAAATIMVDTYNKSRRSGQLPPL